MYLIFGAGALILLAVMLTVLLNPGDILQRDPKPKSPVSGGEARATQQPGAGPTQDGPAQEVTPSARPEPIRQITADRQAFHCVPGDGPTTLTISAVTGVAEAELAIRWRLRVKQGGRTTDWEEVLMEKMGPDEFRYTFDANVWDGTNNFYYPPLLGESWFEYQVFAPDGSYQSEQFQEVTFFPCAQ